MRRIVIEHIIFFHFGLGDFSDDGRKSCSKSEGVTKTLQNAAGFEHGQLDVIDEKGANWFKREINDICINNLKGERLGGSRCFDV